MESWGCLGEGWERENQQGRESLGLSREAEGGALPGGRLGHISGGDARFRLGCAECEGLWDTLGGAVPEEVESPICCTESGQGRQLGRYQGRAGS